MTTQVSMGTPIITFDEEFEELRKTMKEEAKIAEAQRVQRAHKKVSSQAKEKIKKHVHGIKSPVFMLEDRLSLCSPSYSYLINYKIQSAMYNWLDKNTEEAKYLKLSGMGIWSVSNAITTIARIVAIAEVLLKGSGILFSAPFTDECINNTKLGMHEICVQTPKHFLKAACMPFNYFLGAVDILIEPKAFTMSMAECMKINLNHARAGTIHSAQHKKDLAHIDTIVKPKFMKYQGRLLKGLNRKT